MIQRYAPPPKGGLTIDDAGGLVLYSDHRAIVEELVKALRKAVLALAHAEEQSPGLYTEAYAAVSDAIAKHGGEE